MISVGEAKLFFQVFPEFQPPKRIYEEFEKVFVERAVMKRSSKQLVIYISSERIIHKNDIYGMEKLLKEYIFPNQRMQVVISESYHLSQQYDLEALVNAYKDSMLTELMEESTIDYQLIYNAEWFVNDNIITLTMEDDFLSRERSIKIKNYIEDVICNRFHMEAKIGFDYTDEQKKQLREAKDYRLKQETKRTLDIVRRTQIEAGLIGEEDEIDGEKAAHEQKEADADKEKAGVKKLTRGQRRAQETLDAIKSGAKEEPKKEWKRRSSYRNSSPDPDVFFGRNCDGEVIEISALADGIGECVIHGQIRPQTIEQKPIRNEKTILTFQITDFTDTICCKIFVSNADLSVILEDLKEGGFYKIKGVPLYDDWSKEVTFSSVAGIKKISDFTVKRQDLSYEKRIELHMHTGYSDLDSVVDVGEIIKRAREWGHPAIAITDHGVAQAFPVANHARIKNDPLKIIYGVEGYFVDDLNDLVSNSKGQSLDDAYVVFDIETTGINPQYHTFIEFGAVRIEHGEIVDRFSSFVNPERPIPYEIEKLTGISDRMVMDADTVEKVLPRFLEFCQGAVLVAHNASFDTGFVKKYAKELQLSYDYTVVDTMTLSHVLLHNLGKYTLDRICKYLGISLENHHRAIDDAQATAHMFLKLCEYLKKDGITNLDEVNDMGNASPEKIKKSRRYHGIILSKNDTGRYNLYRLISDSHIKYFNRFPIIPKSLIEKYREGLILGSACEAGELFQAVLNGAPEDQIARLVNFYDYLEIQPIGNNMFMIAEEKFSNVNSVEDLQELNRQIIRLGEAFNKPVVATCDVHFLDPEDSIYRSVIQAGKGYKDADHQAPLYFRTTDEMLKEFAYLGSNKAHEIVIENTNKIADMIEDTIPVRPDKCPPIIENSDETLRQICYDKAHEIYGPELPKIVEDRLKKELDSIISNGFAVLYIIAQKLVWKSNDDGYLVGSRGSVGSSFVAAMAGITEVNSLQAHYICPKCHYVDFDSELVKSFSGNSGCDMPDMDCPKCGHPLIKEGHDIPFETFLGFNGDKEPDIDLNFSSEDQPHAHAYTEVLFGEGHAFRAGTIGMVADKTAFGYVYNYYKERGITKRRCEMERIAAGCTDTKRTTGQHPGGIVVLPQNEEIYPFTPIQHPANDVNCGIVTTHFEYHSIDHNLLKLDILGHADPTMIRRLEDLTGKDAKEIALDDKKVMSLFHGTEALGITPEQIGGTELGCLGIPEFGTDFAMQMLIDTNPKNFSDLARIAGLSHGTDVWLGNAQVLIQEGKTELSGAICCRDDIMVYLIHMGLDSNMAFKIMENVRKGTVAKGKCDKWPEWKQAMLDHGVPDWYIWSCEKIKYMFPKAHAVAYVMMAWRVAWFKVYEPLAYYTAFFSIRAKAFDYEKMCQGPERLQIEIDSVKNNPDASPVEQDSLRDMRIVQEMYARGYTFLPIDIYKADAYRFLIIDGKIMPALSTVEGLGGKAAEQLMEAAAKGQFYCKQELKERAKLGQKNIDKLSELGILGDMQDTPQYDFFSMLQ